MRETTLPPDNEIARAAKMQPIDQLGIGEEELENFREGEGETLHWV